MSDRLSVTEIHVPVARGVRLSAHITHKIARDRREEIWNTQNGSRLCLAKHNPRSPERPRMPGPTSPENKVNRRQRLASLDHARAKQTSPSAIPPSPSPLWDISSVIRLDLVQAHISVWFSPSPVVDVAGPTSPWAMLNDTRMYGASALRMEPRFSPSVHRYLSTNATQSGLTPSPQQSFSPVSQDRRAQYVESLSSYYVSDETEWFSFAKGIHASLHRPTFDEMATMLESTGGNALFESKCLYNTVCGLGAWLLGETDKCIQFLQVSWASMVPRAFNSHSLQAVQATYLLVNSSRILLI